MATVQIGFNASKTWTPDSYTSVTCTFWTIDEVFVRKSARLGYIVLVPYENKARWQASDKDFYRPGAIKFPLNSNWVFDGTASPAKAFNFIKTFSAVTDDDGNEINGGIDWSTAEVENITV